MPKTTISARTISLEELSTLRSPLPASWKKAAGLLRHRRKELAQHIKKVRQEWRSLSTQR